MNIKFARTVRGRMILLGVVTLLGLLLICVMAAIKLRENLFEARKVQTRALVEAAHSVAADLHAKQLSGTMSVDEAKHRATQVIKGLRYQGAEYFWINDLGKPVPKMIMHPTVPALDGKVLDDEKFNKATRMQVGAEGSFTSLKQSNLFVTAVRVVDQSGHGFVEYMWPKPKAGGGVSKRTLPKAFLRQALRALGLGDRFGNLHR